MSGTDPVGRRRRLVVWGALGLALVLLLAGSLTLWVKRQALDTNNWVDTSATLLENEDVRAAVAAELVDGLFSGPGVETRPPRAGGGSGGSMGSLPPPERPRPGVSA